MIYIALYLFTNQSTITQQKGIQREKLLIITITSTTFFFHAQESGIEVLTICLKSPISHHLNQSIVGFSLDRYLCYDKKYIFFLSLLVFLIIHQW